MNEQTNIEEPKTAAALRYSPVDGDTAPRVVASGQGYVAEEILRIAREHDIPLREDPELAGALAALDVGSTIPPELFRAVAEIIAFVYRLNGKIR
jgi:flagellar biosynthesis protein